MKKHYSEDLKTLVVRKYNLSKNKSEIAKTFGLPRTSVNSIIKNYETTLSISRKAGSGRKKALGNQDLKKIEVLLRRNKKMTSVMTAKELGGNKVSPQNNTQLSQIHGVQC